MEKLLLWHSAHLKDICHVYVIETVLNDVIGMLINSISFIILDIVLTREVIIITLLITLLISKILLSS